MDKGLKSTITKQLNSCRNMNEGDNNEEAVQVQKTSSTNNIPRKNINTNFFCNYKELNTSPRQIYLKKQASPNQAGLSVDHPGRNNFFGQKVQEPENSKCSPKGTKKSLNMTRSFKNEILKITSKQTSPNQNKHKPDPSIQTNQEESA